MDNDASFGNGVYVSDAGVLHIEFKGPSAQLGVPEARSFKESLEDAIAYAEGITSTPAESTRPLASH
ncbi:MAG TPA: hypothetical protein VM369_03320 [Candidatus Binatia bacterium]|nr:hypothetical protein [Candidatus Binatia bacterium]